MTFQEENNQLGLTVLNQRFFLPWKNNNNFDTNFNRFDLGVDQHLELYITNNCNLQCEYCYLWNNDQIYNTIKDESIILNNLNIFLDWCIEEDFKIPIVDVFSGEILQSKFGLQVLDILYTHCQNGLKTEQIMFPSNCSFIMNDQQTQKIQNYIDLFNELGIFLCISCSIDGLYIDNDSRQYKNKYMRDEIFYDKLFNFAKHNEFFFHPMVSNNSIDKWIQNYEWWKAQLIKYGYDKDWRLALMMLEVRNAGWSEEQLTLFGNFVDYLLKDIFNDLDNNPINFIRFCFDGTYTSDGATAYTPAIISHKSNHLNCTVTSELTVRLGDLAICPCHRTAYDQFLYGHFKVENNKIVGIDFQNIQVMIHILFNNIKQSGIKCEQCIFKQYCMKGCLGSQYENTNDLFIPIDNICKLEQTKLIQQILTLNELNIFSTMKNISNNVLYFDEVVQYLYFAKEVDKQYGLGIFK